MKKIIGSTIALFLAISLLAQRQVQWISSSPTVQWQQQKGLSATRASGDADVEILLREPQQTIAGFGTCFNELGWTSLGFLSAKDREAVLKELFAPGAGANFTLCRMPVGANDFSRKWYSYDETEGDFAMKNFSIANDLETLVPFIRSAQKYNPALKLWASPWSPPSWMKYNRHYAARSVLGDSNFQSEKWGMDMSGINNGLPKEREGLEGTNMFIQEDQYFRAYALYFSKFVQAYKKLGIRIGMVMPQNEFNSAQVFPSCTWTAEGLTRFVSYLGPEMQKQGVQVFFGTVERGNEKLVDSVLTSPASGRFIRGVGFQWAGKDAIPAIHQKYPRMPLYQTEQECGNGKNDWAYCLYAWGLMKHYLSNGANAYLYWNTSLQEGGISTWGWKQNSLVLVDTAKHTYRYTYEYYLMKHLSHFVRPNAKRVATSGTFDNLLAFVNPDKSVAVLLCNEGNTEKAVTIKIGDKLIRPLLQPNSINTLLLK